MPEISKEYAKALFMLAAENKQIDEYTSALLKIKELIVENPDYVDFLSSPAISLSERLGAVDAAFTDSIPEYAVSFIKLLCENGYVKHCGACIEAFTELVRESQNRTTARIYSVIPLTDSQKKALIDKLEAYSGKRIDAVYIEDKSLIGGIKIEMDDMTFDGSVEKQLQKVKGVIKG